MSRSKRVGVSAAVGDVVANADMIAVILAGNIGPLTFEAASLVCKTWLSVCRTDERILRGATSYQGGMTKGALMKLFAIASQEADALPRTSHKRYGGGSYFLYRKDAIDALLAKDGFETWQKRLNVRGQTPSKHSLSMYRNESRQRNPQQEERLRSREMQRQAWLRIR